LLVVEKVTNRVDIIVRILCRSIEDRTLSAAYDMDDTHFGIEQSRYGYSANHRLNCSWWKK
jgi:hypothetical protein